MARHAAGRMAGNMAGRAARHAVPRTGNTPTARRALLALATASLALGAGAGAASAAENDGHSSAPAAKELPEPKKAKVKLNKIDTKAGLTALRDSVGYAVAPVGRLKPNPLAGTGVDPLNNGVGTQVADFKPVSSKQVTGPVAQADSVQGLPVVGGVVGALSK